MYKMLISLIILVIFGLFIFLSLGNFVDVTQKPVQADIIVSLGGDYSGCRLKKALELYKNGYSKSAKLIYTGRDSVSKSVEESGSRRQYLLHNGVAENNIVNIDRSMISNTMEEALFIKKYMLYHNYKSVLIVSHPQHSRRIQTLAQNIAEYKNSGLTLAIVSCNPGWWNASEYYKNKTSLIVTKDEIEKLIYNFFKYGTPLIKFTKYSKNNEDKKWDIDIKEKLN